jgi:hypothetical protein
MGQLSLGLVPQGEISLSLPEALGLLDLLGWRSPWLRKSGFGDLWFSSACWSTFL